MTQERRKKIELHVSDINIRAQYDDELDDLIIKFENDMSYFEMINYMELKKHELTHFLFFRDEEDE